MQVNECMLYRVEGVTETVALVRHGMHFLVQRKEM